MANRKIGTSQIECHTQMPNCDHTLRFVNGIVLRPGATIVIHRQEGDKVLYTITTGPGENDQKYGIISDYSEMMNNARKAGLIE